ncbi:ABC transporter permease [Cellulomonas cellasea]|uniref:ABC transporter permease n=1 Tax=Cellulomonas cellasea TaxID=43670 RepID=UPI0025A49D5D|nr:ABC transporter permease [Cellulomonas cellasea]MDM8084027.1 ABC transporter permease [Cellulomonas cellasea]
MSRLASEWIRARSVRGTWLLMGATMLTTVAVSLLGISGLHGGWLEELPDPWDPTAMSLKGILVGQLLIGMLGAGTITSEYATGMIATSLSISPQRSKLLAAKAGIASALALATALVTVGLSFVAGQGVIGAAGLPAASLGDPGVLRALLAAVAYLTLTALLGLAFGVITRSSSGALALIVVIALLAPALTPGLPGPLGESLGDYWPTTAGQAAYSVADTGGAPPMVGIGVMAVFTVWLTVASHITLRRRDA